MLLNLAISLASIELKIMSALRLGGAGSFGVNFKVGCTTVHIRLPGKKRQCIDGGQLPIAGKAGLHLLTINNH